MEDIIHKIADLESLTRILSVSLEYTNETIYNKDIANTFNLIEDRLSDIKEEPQKHLI